MSFLSKIFGEPLPSVTASELFEKIKTDKKLFLLDVRQPEEYVNSHIAGSKLIPLGDLKNQFHKLPKDRTIACICASGSRSTSAARFLVDQGYTVINLRSGMMSWKMAKYPVEKGK